MARVKRARHNCNSLPFAFVSPNQSQHQFVHPTFDHNNGSRSTPTPTPSICASHPISNPNPSLAFAYSPEASEIPAPKPSYRITPFVRANRPFDLRGLQQGDVDVRQNGIFGTRNTRSRTRGVAVRPSKRGALRSGRKGRPKRECVELGGTSGKSGKMSEAKREREEGMDGMGEDGVLGLEGVGGGKKLKLGEYAQPPSSTKTELPALPVAAKKTIKSAIRNRVVARLEAARKEWSRNELTNNTSIQSFGTQPGGATFSQAGGMKQEYDNSLSIVNGNAFSTQPQSSMQEGRTSGSLPYNTSGALDFSTTAGLDRAPFSPASFMNTASIQMQEHYQRSPIGNGNPTPAPATDLNMRWLNNAVVQGPYVLPSGLPQADAMAITPQSQGLDKDDILSIERNSLQAGAFANEPASDVRAKQKVNQWYVQGHFVGTPVSPLAFMKQEFYSHIPRQGVPSEASTVPSSADFPPAVQDEIRVLSDVAVVTPAPAPNHEVEAKDVLGTAPTPASELPAATPTKKLQEAKTREEVDEEAEETITVHDRDYCECNLCELGRENAKNLLEPSAVSSPSPKQKTPKRWVVPPSADVTEDAMLT